MKHYKPALIGFFLIFIAASCLVPPPGDIPTSSTQIVIPTLITQPTLVPPTPIIEWRRYQNEFYGFSFEYPALFEGGDYKSNCGIKELDNEIFLGHRIVIVIFDSNGKTLKEFASEFLRDKDWSQLVQNDILVGSNEGITVDYRFGQNRFGTITLIKNAEMIYTIGFTAGSWCDFPEFNLTEPQVFTHLVETVQFDSPSPTISRSPSP